MTQSEYMISKGRKGTWSLSVITVVIVTAAVVFYFFSSSSKFKSAEETYLPLARAYEEAAYIPGVPDNPVRQHLNTILSQVLVKPMKPAERIALAKEGLSALKDGEAQIDAIGTAGEKVHNAITYMEEKRNSLGALLTKSQADQIIALAKEEFSIISDIRGLSYRANFHTAEIFNRIILDKGELTPAYSRELNEQIPAVEEQFNKRAALYEQLKSVSARLDKAVAAS